MKAICPEIEEALWEHAHTGSELAEDVRRHVDSCPDCARVIEEAKQILCAASDDYDAAAPDCRSAVMGRIAKPAPRLRPVWACACAVGVLAALIVGGLELRGPLPQPSKPYGVAARPPSVPAPRVEVWTWTQPAPSKSQAIAMVAPHRHRVWHPRRSRPERAKELPVVENDAPTMVAQDVMTKEPASRPIAAVIVTGVVDERSPDMSYGYRERDAATGAVTECSVNRTGNSIEIRMESTSGDPKPAIKGSIDNGKNSNA